MLWDLNRKAQAILYLVPFTLFFISFLISYARIVSQKPGHPKVCASSFHLIFFNMFVTQSIVKRDDLTIELDPKATQMRPFSILGESNWCDVCQIWKPDRTHHCRVCDACILRMDQ